MMTRFILAIAALGIFAVSPAAIFPAKAQNSLYLGLSGGGEIFFDQDVDVDFLGIEDGADVDFKYDTGLRFAGKVGYQIDTNIRVEAEIGYTQADVERDFEFGLLDIESSVDQELTILSLTGGVYLDLWPVGSFVPFVGAGLGVANVDVDNELVDAVDQNVLTAFAEAGLPVTITPSLAIVPSARFVWYATEEKQSEGATVIGDDLLSTQLQVGLNYYF